MTAPVSLPLHVLLATILSRAALPGCAPTVVSLGADAAYTVSEQRSTDEVVDDNKIKIELNKLLADDSAKLWKDVGTVVYRGRVLLLGGVETADAKARPGGLSGGQSGKWLERRLARTGRKWKRYSTKMTVGSDGSR